MANRAEIQDRFRIKEMMLGLALAFSVASKLRVDGLPIGLGEILLLIWFGYALFVQKTTRLKSNYFLFTTGSIGMFLLLLLLGSICGYVYEVDGMSIRTGLGYVFSWSLLLVLLREKDINIADVFIWTIVGFVVSVVIALIWDVLSYGKHVLPWSSSLLLGRWRNLSSNPNQFALLLLVIPFITLSLLTSEKIFRWWLPIVGLFAILLAVIVRSDALWVSWLVGSAVVIVSVLIARKRLTIRRYYLLGGILLFICATFVGGYKTWIIYFQKDYQHSSHVLPGTQVRLNKADIKQAGVRFDLWKNGIKAIGLSPWVGFGPGVYSGYKEPFTGREAHNTLIDWMTQAGIIGGVILLVYWAWTTYLVIKGSEPSFIGLVVALGIFACFHYTMRQPLFWLIPALLVFANPLSKRERENI